MILRNTRKRTEPTKGLIEKRTNSKSKTKPSALVAAKAAFLEGNTRPAIPATEKNSVQFHTIDAEIEGQRLDNYLIRILKGVPKSYLYRIIRLGEVRINKKRAKPSSRLKAEDIVRIPPIRVSGAPDESFPLHQGLIQRLSVSILFENEAFLVINKPAGLAVHGGSGLTLGVIEAFRKMRPDCKYLELVHRLDRETSGCLLLAKKRSQLRALQRCFEERTIKKVYWALLENSWEEKKSLTVNVPLAKNTLKSGERMVVVSSQGKPSETRFHLLENYAQACLMEIEPKTGRTHQIRVHSAHLGHPVLGDEKYRASATGITLKSSDERLLSADSATKNCRPERLYLHARSLEFVLEGQSYHYVAELDEKFNHYLAFLKS